MATTGLRIGIVGCGPASVGLAGRLLAAEGVTIAGCVDADRATAEALAARVSSPDHAVPAFGDHLELIATASPDALVLSSPHRSHYRWAMDGLQAGCHLLIASPLSISVQESVDIVNLARTRGRKVSVGHHFRLLPTMIRARAMILGGEIGRLRLIIGVSTSPPTEVDRSGGGVLTTSGIRLVDALLWASGRPAELVSAIRSDELGSTGEVTSATIRLAGSALASIAVSGVADASSFALEFHGESGRIRATDRSLSVLDRLDNAVEVALPEAVGDVAADFIGAVLGESSSCCPASEAIDAVRVLEAIARSAAIGQFVGLA